MREPLAAAAETIADLGSAFRPAALLRKTADAETAGSSERRGGPGRGVRLEGARTHPVLGRQVAPRKSVIVAMTWRWRAERVW